MNEVRVARLTEQNITLNPVGKLEKNGNKQVLFALKDQKNKEFLETQLLDTKISGA
jgi:hypothetical protein